MIYLLLYIISSFPWYPISESEIYGNLKEMILNSKEISSIVMRYGGEEYLVNGLIHLDGDVFKGGEMVLLTKDYKIARTPENLQLLNRNIEMEKYNRYTALYREGRLKDEWMELERESEFKLGISSLENLPIDKLRELFPERIRSPEEEMEERGFELLDIEEEGTKEREIEGETKYPRKHYISFILVEENWREKLFPVILHLSPIDEKIEEMRSMGE
ncbi:MAG: hypothetical protein E3J23_06130 [Candidatus Stahlbacteria bacterium]|nr:MAG: hypothetical protein E3J23_06130 [Candidatus Stahlbacteria bacterium]